MISWKNNVTIPIANSWSGPETICRVELFSLLSPYSLWCRWPIVARFVFELEKGNHQFMIGQIYDFEFTHEIEVMFSVKILSIVFNEVFQVLHCGLAASDQSLQFILKFRNLKTYFDYYQHIMKLQYLPNVR